MVWSLVHIKMKCYALVCKNKKLKCKPPLTDHPSLFYVVMKQNFSLPIIAPIGSFFSKITRVSLFKRHQLLQAYKEASIGWGIFSFRNCGSSMIGGVWFCMIGGVAIVVSAKKVAQHWHYFSFTFFVISLNKNGSAW